MCGIFGYINYHFPRSVEEILNVLLGGLQRVEYRGYDSAGICIDHNDSQQSIALLRNVGNISCLRDFIFSKTHENTMDFKASFDTHVGIAHTRWATHGVPSERNSHPQLSNNKKFIVVHNGIMTNFMSVKQMLLGKGYHFDSDTDTEVIAVLAEELFKQERTLSLAELVFKIIPLVDGAYAILLKSVNFPGELVGCRKGSPLVVGIRRSANGNDCTSSSCMNPNNIENGNNNNNDNNNNNNCVEDVCDIAASCEVYFASDVNSFIEYTRDVTFLENDDIVHFKNGVLAFYSIVRDSCATPVHRVMQRIDYSPEGLCKGGYEHFMLKEILEQPDSVLRSMHGRIDFKSRKVHFDTLDTSVVTRLRKAHRFLLISCGTSYHSCLAVRSIFEELFPDTVIAVESALEFMDREPPIRPDDVCIFVSQSGETADTLMALQHCSDRGAVLIGISNVPGSSVLRLTDYPIILNAGVEVGVASTKAYTCQVIVLTLLALLLSEPNNNSGGGDKEQYTGMQQRREMIIRGLEELPGAIAHCLKTVSAVVMSLASEWRDISTLLVLGRGYDHASAMESALKIKEVSYIYTEGVHSGDLKHGPLALVDEHSKVISFCTGDRHFERSKNAIQQVKARGGRVVAVVTKKDMELLSATKACIEVPPVVDCLQGVVNILPLQLLAYYLAVERGHNVDYPRNLAKSVTVQ